MSIGLTSAYKEENRRQKLRQSRTGSIIAVIVVPLGLFLDYLVYPELVSVLASIRILCGLAIAPTIALHHTAIGKANASLLPFTWPMFINVAVCFMIYFTGGAASAYYAGLNVVLIIIIFILPLSIVESLIFSVITVSLYVATCIIAGNVPENFTIFYSNLNFLLMTAAVSCFVSHVNSRNSFHQFRLTFELDIKNQQLTNLEKLRTSFFANISHELRTPLTLILSPVQDLLASDSDLQQKVRQVLETAYANGLRLLKLVNELLEVIRIEEGKSQLNMKPVFIDAFLSELVDSIAYLSSKKQIRLEKHLECPAVQIMGDMHALEKIFINLLHNAIKFSDANGTVSVATIHAYDKVHVLVADTGIGISEEDLPFIFDRFRQADSSTTRQYQGSGLGLSLAKDLTEQLKGEIDVRSQLGVGTKFKLTFPVYRVLASAPRVGGESEEQDALQRLYRLANRSGMLHLENSHHGAIEQVRMQTPAVRSHHTVLVVEDEHDLREYLVAALSDTYPILQAVDGEEALNVIREQRPSLVVLDLMLPKIDGLDVCARIKQDEQYRGTRIILLTARIDENAKVTALNNGADDFLTKPFSTLELQTRIRNLLLAADFERELVAANGSLEQALRELKNAQAQLVQSEKTHAMEYLSAGILHEINNPLNYTLTALQLARGLPSAKGDAMMQEIIDDMREGMTRIKGIVGDLQSFAHPSPMDKQSSFKLASAVRTALTFTSKDAGNVRIVDATDKDVSVIGSKNHIVQILINLLTNAVKAVRAVEALRAGEILLRSSAGEGRLTVSVRDNGTGIDAAILDKIFDPFFTTRDVGEGMGLGLAVSQTIARVHGGVLQARSVQGEWTEFSFDLEMDVKGA